MDPKKKPSRLALWPIRRFVNLSLPLREMTVMTFPFRYTLQNGTLVEVSLDSLGYKYVFDLFKNGLMFDSFIWTPEANIRKEDVGLSDLKSLRGKQLEAVEAFREVGGVS